MGVLPPVVALAALVAIPPTTHAGQVLKERLPDNELINKHAELGDKLLPWVAVLFVVAAVSWFLLSRPGTGTLLRTGTAVVAVVAAVGSAWMTYRIGDSGAEAVWDGIGTAKS